MKAARKRKKKNRSFSIATILEMLISLLMIPFGLFAAEGLAGTENAVEKLAALMILEFVLLALTNVLRASARRYRTQIPLRRKLDFIFAGLYLACAVAIFIEPSLLVMTICGIVFLSSLVANCVLAILRNRRWYSILVNAVVILLVLYFAIDVWSDPESWSIFDIAVMLFIAMTSLVRIMSVTFSRLRLDLLRDIVHQTYAAEIIFGLLLLIASFSFVLLYTDTESFSGEYTNALWYCFAVVTTIGFGDMTATSTIGRILSVILGVYGIIVVALITSIIVNFYGEMKKTGNDETDPVPEAEQKAEGNGNSLPEETAETDPA